MKKIIIFIAMALMLFCGSELAIGQTIPEEAMRHFDRGTAAVELAVSKSDFETAAREFSEAARLAPEWPEAHFNLGLVREEIDDLDGAVASLKRYLELAPQAGDAAAVRSQVNKIEYRRERRPDGIWAVSALAPGFSCSPSAFMSTHHHVENSSLFFRDRLELEIRSEGAEVKVRPKTGYFSFADLPYVSALQKGERLIIQNAVLRTCGSALQADQCPWFMTLDLTRISAESLEGQVSIGGPGYWTEWGVGKVRHQYQCSGGITFRRSGK